MAKHMHPGHAGPHSDATAADSHAAHGQGRGFHAHETHGHGAHGHGGHGHGAHGHAHGHIATAPPNPGRAFAIAVGLNTIFVVCEVVAGLLTGSLALLADAAHNLSDVLSLILAWTASVLAARPPSGRFTYGLKSASILAAMANATLLWVAIGAIVIETVGRFSQPAPVAGLPMMVVAGIGIAINASSALLFARGSKSDLNLRAAFVHLMADAAVSLGVVVAGLAIYWTGLEILDPLASLAITAMIAWSSWGLLRESLRMGLLAVPARIDIAAVRRLLESRPGVAMVRDLHIWPMSTTETALTAHLVMPGGHPGDGFLQALAHDLDHDFGICHPTVQIETDAGLRCSLDDPPGQHAHG